MKVSNSLALAAALVGQSSAQFFGMPPKVILSLVKVLPPALVTPELALQFNKQVNFDYGKVADATSSIARVQNLPARKTAIAANSKTVKIRYGPYTVPSMLKKNGLEDEGSLWNFPDKDVPKPCDECTILAMNAGLEYPDGSEANIDSNAWLHHMVLFNSGPGRSDPTCVNAAKSFPHILVGTTPQKGERIFASGNERVPFDANWRREGQASDGAVAGYKLNKEDKFAMIVDFMNESDKDKTVYLTMTYDIVDGHPKEMDDVRVVWFDIDQCGLSEVMPPQQKGAFTLSAVPWKSNVAGEVLGWFGHLHDGGANITMTIDGKPECVSEATYGGSPAFVQTMEMGPPGSAMKHISNMTICSQKTYIKEGQTWGLDAKYDYDRYAGNLLPDGKQMEVMGISFMYVRKPSTA